MEHCSPHAHTHTHSLTHSLSPLSLPTADGRLERELAYTRSTLGEGSGTTSDLVIQTPRHAGSSVLSPESLLLHYRALQAAADVSVDMYDM